MDLPEITTIKKIVKENYKVKTFYLDKNIDAKPGQFVMAWLPGIDEKPFTLSGIGKETSITVEEKGRFTKELFKLKTGDKIGIRGPYGNGFSIKDNACVVAGGLGIAPLKQLISKLKKPIIIFGVKNKDDLLFKNEIKKHKINVCSDDGSIGFKGFTTDLLKKIISDKKNKIKFVYTCGPEIMMKKVFEIAEKNKIECEASLERYMKCGFGICGQCTINEFRVCKDGPVFSSSQLRKMAEFGKSARMKTGERVSLKKYFGYSTS